MGKELLRTMDRLGMILDVDANHVAIGSDLDGAFAGISYCTPGCSDTAMRMQ